MSRVFYCTTVNYGPPRKPLQIELILFQVKSTELHEKTGVEKWSSIVKKRRLLWLGHLLRLDEETPAKKALVEYLRKVKRKCGRRKTYWIDIIKSGFQYLNINDETKLPQHLNVLSGDKKLSMTLTQHMTLNIIVFSIWVFFHNHSQAARLQGKREDIPFTPHYYFH